MLHYKVLVCLLIGCGWFLVVCSPADAGATSSCPGDCNGDRVVTVDELLVGVSIGLDETTLSTCPAFDVRADQTVTIDELLAAVDAALFGCTGSTPALLASQPADGAIAVPRTAWIRLAFAGPVDGAALQGFNLVCDNSPQAVRVYAVTADVLVANPSGDLPATAACMLSWSGPDGDQAVSFTTAAAGPPATVRYDRTDLRATVPFPDDVWLASDTTTRTGVRLAVPLPTGPGGTPGIFRVLLRETNKLDGFSPIAHFVIELSDSPDPATLPQTPADSLDPLATVGLFDLDPASPAFAQRIPFRLEIRDDTTVSEIVSHTLWIFPSVPLTPRGRYGFVVTRRALVDATRPFDASEFFRAALRPPVDGEPSVVGRVRELAGEVLDVVATRSAVPIPPDDIALALRISIRSTDDIPGDLLSIKEQVLAAPPPAISNISVTAETRTDSDVAAYVEGMWDAPDWRDGLYFAHDDQGHPMQTRTNKVHFVLALPKAALNGPVPVTMYQHGNPGSAEAEVPSSARRSLAGAGFAVIGFTDNLNREVSPGITDDAQAIAAQVGQVFFALIQTRKVPDYWVETNAEQIAFLRMIQGLGTLDVLPVGAPDGVPDLDVTAPLTYLGISEGANHAPGFLPYAPEIRGAALVAGGARLTEVLLHQQAEGFLTLLGPLYPDLSPADIWVGLALFQTIYDNQDPHNHGRFIYRDPVVVAGTTRKASILQIEGLEDPLVPNHASESLAWQMGPIPHLKPVQRAVPFLELATGSVTANIDAETTAAFFQYVPVGVPGIDPTPGCVSQPPVIGTNGHFCAQAAAESLRQRVVFFQSTVTNGVPTIVDPFSEPGSRAAFERADRHPGFSLQELAR